MHQIFFIWKGTYDALVATFFHQHGPTRTIPIGTNLFIGAVSSRSSRARLHLQTIANMTLLPGPNASLAEVHASILGPALPGLSIQTGSPFSTVLAHLHGMFGDPEFDPTIY